MDALQVVEAAYRIEQPEKRWLGGILDAARPQFPACVAAASFTYRIEADGKLAVKSIVAHDDFPEMDASQVAAALNSHSPEVVAALYGRIAFGFASEAPDFYRPRGITDWLGINGLDPNLSGCCVILGFRDLSTVKRTNRAVGARLAEHLVAAHRIRRRLIDPHENKVEPFHATMRIARRSEPCERRPNSITLTPRERDIADLVERGLTNPEIGRVLGISKNTVRNRLAAVFERGGLSNRAELIARLHSQ